MNKDGFITVKGIWVSISSKLLLDIYYDLDFKNVSGRRLSNEQIDAVFTSFDLDKDGKLSYYEFKKFMMRNSKLPQNLNLQPSSTYKPNDRMIQ